MCVTCFFIFQEEYFKDRKLAQLGGAVAAGTVTSMTKVPVDQALFLRYYGKMGKMGYVSMRLAMLPYGVRLPTYNETTVHKYSNIVPSNLVCTVKYFN